jgi:hypothetical protein
MVRSRLAVDLRDAALVYASRGIPVLPLHHPVGYRSGARPVPAGQPLPQPGVGIVCSCGDRACGQVAKHPLGALVPHGVKDATCNRARVLAWWTRHPLANIGLATGHRFDVLDVDGPTGAAAIRAMAVQHGLASVGPLVRTGGGGWHYYLAPTGLGNAHPTGLEHVDWRGRGGYVVAPPSRHASGQAYRWVPGRDLDTTLAEIPGPLLERLERRPHQRPSAPVALRIGGDRPQQRYGRLVLAEELARVAAAPVGQRNQQLWESARNLYNLVATGALGEPEVHHGLLAAAERCGLLGEEPRQTHRTLVSARQVGLDHPRRPPEHSSPDRIHPRPLSVSPRREDGERARTERR